jgi:shikimate dehydrogenase
LVRLAVLGDPLAFTRSPELHRAGLAALGLEGDSRALRTPIAELGSRLASLASENVAGLNVTHPLKEVVMSHLARVSPDAARARSVNTVGLAASGWWGETTDGPGFLDWLRHLGRDPVRERVLIFGAGGAARSIALAMSNAGAEPVRVVLRGAANAAGRSGAGRATADTSSWQALEGARVPLAEGDALERALEGWATAVVNATPLAGEAGPRQPSTLPASALVLDLVYGRAPSAWSAAARARGLEAHDGLGLLVFQARRSLSLWLEREVPLEPLMRAVGGLP